MNLSTRRATRFFRDPLLEANPGESYEESPSFHKTHRNNSIVPITGDGTRQVFDNLNVSHQIPRSDRQYSWITSSITNTDPNDLRYAGFMKTAPIKPPADAPYYKIGDTYNAFFDYVTASETDSSIYQNTTRLNLLVTDATASSLNTLGSDTIATTDISSLAVSKRLNALLIRRGDLYGWNWKATRQGDHPILRIEKEQNEISAYFNGALASYPMRPANQSGRPVLVNIYKTTEIGEDCSLNKSINAITLKASYNNYKQGFNDAALEDISDLNLASRKTNFQDLIKMVKTQENYTLNWVLYSENIFPSQRNAFSGSIIYRDTYDNQYWRDSKADREALGKTFENSFVLVVSQSSWILDAPADFETRAAPPTAVALKMLAAANYKTSTSIIQTLLARAQ